MVGDTFPVGCSWSPSIVYHEAFETNPDRQVELYQTPCGIYQPGCGLNQLMLSWGHDEYIYHVARTTCRSPHAGHAPLPLLLSHSSRRAYQHLMAAGDAELLRWVVDFNQYDLYTKRDERMDVAGLRPYYEQLIARYFPPQINW